MSRTVSRGHLRVDATRAIGKLREHLLVDQHLYLCELARCAVASGADKLDVRFDADDVIVDLDHLRVARETLTGLLDYLLVDAESPEEQRLQRLALGVNAALGLEPRWVDVVHLGPERCVRVRYRPDLLQRGCDPDVTPIARPRGAAHEGVRVHLRHRLGWSVMVRAASSARPREVERLVAAAADLDIPLTINGEVAQIERHHPLLTVAFDVYGLRRGWVELGPPNQSAAAEYLEHGIRLLGSIWVPALALPAWDGLALPSRLVVDAFDLPTNASRSALQQQAPLVQQALIAGSEALQRGLRALVCLATDVAITDPDVVVHDVPRAAAEDCLGAIVVGVVSAIRRGREVSPELAALLELPLFRDATGRPLTVNAVLQRGRVSVMRRDEPLPEALAPWVEEVVWLRGRAVERALAGVEEINVAQVLAEAEEGERRRAHLLAHAPVELQVVAQPEHVLRGPFAYDDGPLAGLHGEVAVAVVDPAVGHPGSTFHVYFEGRLLDTLTVTGSSLPLAIDAAVQWPKRLLPTWGWDGVIRGHRLAEAIWGTTLAAIDHVGELAAQVPHLDAGQAAVAATVVRAAILCMALEPPDPELGLGRYPMDSPRYLALGLARIWPLSDGTWTTCVDLSHYTGRTGALCAVGPGDARGIAPDGRPVVVLDEDAAPRLGRVLRAAVVPYQRALGDAGSSAERIQEGERSCQAVLERIAPAPASTLAFTRGSARGLARLAIPGKVVAVHAGYELGPVDAQPGLPGVVIVIDDDSLVPTPDWDGVQYQPDWDLAGVLREFVERLADAIEGDAETMAQLGLGHPEAEVTARAFLLEWLANARHERRQRHQEKRGKVAPFDPLVARVERLPLLDELDEEGAIRRVDLAHVVRRRRTPRPHLPLLDEVPGFETLEWFPIVAKGRLREAIRACVPRTESGEPHLDSHRRQAEWERVRRAVCDRPPLPVTELCELADSTTPTVTHHAAKAPLASLTLGLPGAPLRLDSPCCEVLFDGHPLTWLPRSAVQVPVVVRFSLADAELVHDWTELTEDGLTLVQLHVADCAKQLASELLTCAAARGDWLLTNLPALDLLATLQQSGAWPIATTELARRFHAWPTVQGETDSFGKLRRQGKRLWYGRERYASWHHRQRGRALLDEPTLHLPTSPTGLALASIFTAGGYQLIDVTEAIAQLQEQRARGGLRDIPRLTGQPAHPDLRVELVDVEVTEAEGELELTAGEAEVVLIDLEGKRRTIEAKLPFPLRAVARVEASTLVPKLAHRVVQAIARGGARLLDRLAPRIDELPAVARESSLALFFYRIQRSKRAPRALASVRLFLDTEGRCHTFRDLVRYEGPGKLGYTELGPPYPRRPPAAPVLRLTKEQAELIRSWLPLVSATKRLGRQLRAEQRAQAVPRTSITMHQELRRQCLVTTTVSVDSLQGEIGLLGPTADAPTLELLVGRRPLALLHPDPSWPVVGVVNDDTIEPNRWFDAPRREGDAERVLARIAELAREKFQAWLPAPANVHGSTWLDQEPLGKHAIVSGRVWLPARWPVEPRVDVLHADAPGGVSLTPVVKAGPELGGRVPIAGHLVVWGKLTKNATRSLFARLKRRTGELFAEVAKRDEQEEAGQAEQLALYRADLGLLGIGRDATVATADGKGTTLAAVRRELDEQGRLWWTDGEETDAADLPATHAGMVLPASESALLEVLRQRTRSGVVRRLCASEPEPVPPSPVVAPPPRRDFGGIARWLHDRMLGSPPPADCPPVERETDPLADALLQRLLRHAVLAPHVAGVERRPSRRAVRYDASKALLLLASEHPLLDALDLTVQDDRRLLDALVAAATTEINRALGAVTNASERTVLVTLLTGAK